MVIVAAPFWLGAGVSVTVRLLPLPPNTILVGGIREGLEEPAERVRLPAGVWASFTVNTIGPMGVSSGVVLSAMVEMVGTVLVAALTKTVKVRVTRLLEAPLSFTVTAITAVPCPVDAGRNRTLPEEPGLV